MVRPSSPRPSLPPLHRGYHAIRGAFVGALADASSRVLSLFALTRGRWRLFRHDVDGAVVALDAAVRRTPDAFAPWLHLARAHLLNRDFPRARGALARARELSPERFDAVAVRALRHDGFELTVLAEPEAPAPVSSASAGATTPVSGARAERAAVRTRTRDRASLHPLGDCRDLDEYARFRSMPPITLAERESVDWDAVADDLLD